MGTPHVHEWKRTPEGDYCDGCDTFWRDWNTERLEREVAGLRVALTTLVDKLTPVGGGWGDTLRQCTASDYERARAALTPGAGGR